MYLVKINQKLQFLGMSDAMNKFHGIYDVYVLGENNVICLYARSLGGTLWSSCA